MKIVTPIVLFMAVVFLAGCAVGPKYRRPALDVPAQWSPPPMAGMTNATEPQSDQWWKEFQDEQLDRLIEQAVAANHDLQLASARVIEARAARGFVKSGLAPQITASGSATRDRQIGVGLMQTQGGGTVQEFAYETNEFSGQASLSWELDIFGKVRNQVKAANADLVSAEQDRRNVLIILLSDVASYYCGLRGAQLRLEIARNNIATAKDSLDLTTVRARAGQATERDVAQAESVLREEQAVVPTLESAISFDIHRLGVLIGRNPESLQAELTVPKAIPPIPPAIPTGTPVDLLRRRPDVESAEDALIAATARVGVAKADYFPDVVLLGTVGRQATQLHDLSLGFGNYFGVGPTVSLPLFTGGKIRSNVAIANARVRESAEIYKSTVLRAFEETENAFVAYGNEQERKDRLADAVKADETSFELSNVQYKAGLTDFLTVLDAQRALFADQDLLAQSQTQVATNLIGLYKALGGGWSISPSTN
jgi:outer membrane protein, multidrug efflux system